MPSDNEKSRKPSAGVVRVEHEMDSELDSDESHPDWLLGIAKLDEVPDAAASALARVDASASRQISADDPLPLGPFDLLETLGEGGMGRVYRARHRSSGVEVAVKVITGLRGCDPKYRDGFLREVQSTAGLDHPGLVSLLDYGTVDAHSAERAAGVLLEDNPWFAMELADGGCLGDLVPLADWAELRWILESVLAALAHAHARGVVHRDLKPANILVHRRDDEVVLKLADFGIAHAQSLDEIAGTTDVFAPQGGTPHMMAPEQFRGAWRDYGPWTDLYALGCMAHMLACGEPPFRGVLVNLVTKHLFEPPPRLEPLFDVPDGFDRWVATLLRKRPRDRYRRAADALDALRALDGRAKGSATLVPNPARTLASRGPGSARGGRDQTVESFSFSGETLDSAMMETQTQLEDGTRVEVDVAPNSGEWHAFPAPTSVVPEAWTTEERRMVPRLEGVGLGVFGLREIPFVGRRAERDAIWSAILRVSQTSVSEALVVSGDSGAGKSRLVEWMSRRAHELGAVSVFRARHDPSGSSGDALGRMVGEFLGTVGMAPKAVHERTLSLLGELVEPGPWLDWEAAALTHIVCGGHPDIGDVPPVHFSTPAELYLAITSLMEVVARERPLLVWLDDAQWAGEGLGLVRFALTQATSAPLLFVLTRRLDSAAARPLEQERLTELVALDRVSTIHVEALAPADLSELVARLLHLSPSLARDVTRRCDGNPLFAVQLVGDWVQRGALCASSEGFRLVESMVAGLPDTIHALWSERVAELVAGTEAPEAARRAVELAAALGRRISIAEWQAAASLCERVDGTAVAWRELVDGMIVRRLAERDAGGWEFTHAMLRESLERDARQEGRWQAYNRACAEMLLGRANHGDPNSQARLAGYYLAAGEPAAALEPLGRSIEGYWVTGAYDRSKAQAQTHDAAMAELGELAPVSSRVRGGLAWMRIHRVTGELERSMAEAERVAEIAHHAGDQAALAEALSGKASVETERGNLAEATRLYEEAVMLLEAADEGDLLVNRLTDLGDAMVLLGEHEKARKHLVRAHEICRTSGDLYSSGRCLLRLARLALRAGDHGVAADQYREALAAWEGVGNKLGEAVAHNGLADLERFRGSLEAADRGYRKARQAYLACGSSDAIIPYANLGLVLLQQGRYQEARGVIKECCATFEREGRLAFLATVEADVLPCLAALGDWDAWRVHIARAEQLLASTGVVDPDIAWPTQLAGELAAESGRSTDAQRAFEISLAQWEKLGDKERAAKVRGQIAALG